jgi:hypothetical protein
LLRQCRGPTPPKSGNFSESSIIKYSFLLLKLPHIFTKLQVLATKPCYNLYVAEPWVYKGESRGEESVCRHEDVSTGHQSWSGYWCCVWLCFVETVHW